MSLSQAIQNAFSIRKIHKKQKADDRDGVPVGVICFAFAFKNIIALRLFRLACNAVFFVYFTCYPIPVCRFL